MEPHKILVVFVWVIVVFVWVLVLKSSKEFVVIHYLYCSSVRVEEKLKSIPADFV